MATTKQTERRSGWRSIPAVGRAVIVLAVAAVVVWQWSAWKGRSDYHSGFSYCRGAMTSLDHDLSQQQLGAGIVDPTDPRTGPYNQRFIVGVTRIRREIAYPGAGYLPRGARARAGCDEALRPEISNYPSITAVP